MEYFKNMTGKQGERAYVLPATILLCVAISIVIALYLQVIASSSQALNGQSFQTMAQEAARSGIAYATGCLTEGTKEWIQGAKLLRPNTDCNGVVITSGSPSAPSQYVYQSSDNVWRSTFEVTSPVSKSSTYDAETSQIVSKGKVELLQAGVPVKTIEATKISVFKPGNGYLHKATGQVATDVRADQHTCAIANGKLWCWGQNTSGELGLGTVSLGEASPKLVGGALTGKYVSKVTVSDANTCAIADGKAYCWGAGISGLLGNGTNADSNVPVEVKGDLQNRKVTDLSISSQNYPFPQPLPVMRHGCAVTDGAAYCWGGNDYYQLGNIVCLPLLPCDTDQTNPFGTISDLLFVKEPTPVYGYDNNNNQLCVPIFGCSPYGRQSTQSELFGHKIDRIGAGGHFSCAITEGRQICWGMRLPAVWGMPKPFTVTSTPYEMVGANTQPIDTTSYNFSGDISCGMSSWNFNCMGYTPAFSGLASFLTAYFLNAPVTVLSNYDVVDHDNGQWSQVIPWVNGFFGTFCAVAPTDTTSNRNAGCVGSIEGAPTGTDPGVSIFGNTKFNPLLTGGSPDFTGKVPTRIAASGMYGTMIANGQVFSWGLDGGSGALGNGGGMNDTVNRASQISIGSLGADPGTYAADGSASTGGGHSCGIVNGQIFCWGKNDDGQLGMGAAVPNGTNVKQPRIVSSVADRVFRKVSAGTNHTCGISIGQLYCWGRNTDGQLGDGTLSSKNVPTLVGAFAGKRVTDVSAGDTGTCAIADGRAYCWGKNNRHQIGDNSTTTRPSPVPVTGLTDKATTSISMGKEHACAVANGNGYCWGTNANYATGRNTNLGDTNTGGAGQLILGTAGGVNSNQLTPAFTQISAGNNFTCAVINSFVSCWGRNTDGQIGTDAAGGTGSTDGKIPTKVAGVAGGLQANDLAVGDAHACAVLQGIIYCWGNAASGRVGDGQATTDRLRPVVVNTGAASGNASISISAGLGSSCSVANGRILCWGDATSGQSGIASAPGAVLQPQATDDYVTDTPFKRGPIF